MLGFCGPYEFKGLRLMLQCNFRQKETFCPMLRRTINYQCYPPCAFFGERVLLYNLAIGQLCGNRMIISCRERFASAAKLSDFSLKAIQY